MFGDPRKFRFSAKGSFVGIADDDRERRTASTITAEELAKYADDCRVMGLATNDPKWDTLAERWLRCANWFNELDDARIASRRDTSPRTRARVSEPAA